MPAAQASAAHPTQLLVLPAKMQCSHPGGTGQESSTQRLRRLLLVSNQLLGFPTAWPAKGQDNGGWSSGLKPFCLLSALNVVLALLGPWIGPLRQALPSMLPSTVLFADLKNLGDRDLQGTPRSSFQYVSSFQYNPMTPSLNPSPNPVAEQPTSSQHIPPQHRGSKNFFFLSRGYYLILNGINY